ncbi:MAG: ATP-binding protein [Deltaproteobacteria bacterium]|nr:ATP-binding protein [Deltaproteobacteria bacterium]
MKKIRLIIESDLENVALAGMAINKICSLTPLNETQSFQVELCSVEAINNSIIHAYNSKSDNNVEIILTLKERLIEIEICDHGKPMNINILEEAVIKYPDNSMDNISDISESGRGLGFIKEFMNHVTYSSDDKGNHLVMIKRY